jgi:hypothetical protein
LDVKIRDDSPSPPIHPRSTPASARLHRRSRSPPRGPRNYLKTPTAPASFYHFNAATKDWPRRNNTMSEGPATPVEAEPKPVIEPGPPMPPAVTLPVIPVYQTKPSLTPELDAEVC